MKIAIIQPRSPYHVAGSEKVSFKHAEYLSKLGHTVDFYTSVSKDYKESFLFKGFITKKLENINIRRFDIGNSIVGLYNETPDNDHIRWVTESIAFDEKIFESLKQNIPDIILSYYLPDSLFKPSGVPNVVYLSGYPSKPISLYKSFIRFCNAVISISSIVTTKWSDELQKVSSVYLLGTGVDYPLILQEVVKSKAKYNLVFAGRLVERKGVLTLVDAFREVSKTRDDVHLWILGEGELSHILEGKINEFGLSEKVTITGLVQNPYDYFAIADICVFPSHQGDGLMGTVLESMAAGKPVITSTNNGNEDVIVNGENGILVEPKDISALTLSINDLLNDDMKRKDLGEKAMEYIANNVAWEENIKKLSNILEEVVSKAKNLTS